MWLRRTCVWFTIPEATKSNKRRTTTLRSKVRVHIRIPVTNGRSRWQSMGTQWYALLEEDDTLCRKMWISRSQTWLLECQNDNQMANWIEKRDAFAWWVMCYTGVQQCNCIIAAVIATSMNKYTRLEWGPSRELWWMCVTTCWTIQPIRPHCNRMQSNGDHHALQAGQHDNLPILDKGARPLQTKEGILMPSHNDKMMEGFQRKAESMAGGHITKLQPPHS